MWTKRNSPFRYLTTPEVLQLTQIAIDCLNEHVGVERLHWMLGQITNNPNLVQAMVLCCGKPYQDAPDEKRVIIGIGTYLDFIQSHAEKLPLH